MFAYLSKKIAIPNNVQLNCISWNKEHGYIAVAGTDGLLKVLKLEQASENGHNKGGLAAVSNLSMNQTLVGHKAALKVVTWNEMQQKLTSADLDGVIMVWMLYKSSWYEEMTNDRKKSVVTGMSWTSDGSRICIVYDDGVIIVGSVDGNRIWGKELKNTSLTGVQWSPDNRLLLFAFISGECHVYDIEGNFIMKLNIQCMSTSVNRTCKISGLCWYSGKSSVSRPQLAICYEIGKVQIMRNENDEAPIMFETNMKNADANWNHDGSVLAVCGTITDSTCKDENYVVFYSPYGKLYRSIKVPGNEITSLSWEGHSLRIAMTVDSYIYFANIRPEYVWCYFEKTIVFLNVTPRENGMYIITFWNTILNQSYLKEVDLTMGMAANSDYCVIAVNCSKGNMEETSKKSHQLLLCNSIGTTVDTKYTDIKPEFIAINSSYVTIASKEEILVWNYHTPKSSSNLIGVKAKKDKEYHMNDLSFAADQRISAIALSEKLLLIASESGFINEYNISNIELRHQYKIMHQPYKMSINCNSTRAVVIDNLGVMTFVELEENHERQLNYNRFERKEVWDVCWAKDNPLLLSIMEKSRMYIFRGYDPEEPIATSGYICIFEDLEITSVLLDDIISRNETQNPIGHLIQHKIKSLRDTDDLLAHVGIDDAKQFIEDNPHPRLWRVLAEASLKKLDIDTAETSFVRCANYPGIQLIKRLRTIPSAILQRAEIAAFYGEFEEAEKLYIDADRRDLAVSLRIELCDWFRVVQLYRMGSGASDQQMENAWREIGNHYSNLRSWESAKEYYEKAHDFDSLIESLYHLEEFDELEKCIQKLPEKSPSLLKIGDMFASVGMCNEAVAAYLKMGEIKSAINICVNLNHWSLAVDLAREHNIPHITSMLSKHVTRLLKQGRLTDAVELQKKVGRYFDAARLLMKLAEREAVKKTSLLRAKKLYVLAGILAEEHIKSLFSQKTEGQNFDRSAILIEMPFEDAETIERIWQCAEAYHYMLLAQRQLRFGVIHNALVTALRLQEYENILNIEEIYSVIALASYADRCFDVCTKALNKLASLDYLSEKGQQEYRELAASIFSKKHHFEEMENLVRCYSCETLIPDSISVCTCCGVRFPACILTGKPINEPTNMWICNACAHCALASEIIRQQSCPLCHNSIASTVRDLNNKSD